MSQKKSPQITLLVFKDNFASRTFQIPLTWISRFGLLLGIILLVTISSTFFAIKYYRQTLLMDAYYYTQSNIPIELSQNQNSKDSESSSLFFSSSKNNLSFPSEKTSKNNKTKTENEVIQSSSPSIISESPAPTFSFNVPSGNKIPLTIEAEKINWHSKNLRLQFTIVAQKSTMPNTPGPVEGRILILARSQEGIFTYPSGIVSMDSNLLFLPEKGEPFLVNRLKEIKTEFGPFKTQQSLLEVEIFVFNLQNQVVIHKKIPPPVFKNLEIKKKKTIDPSSLNLEEQNSSSSLSTFTPATPESSTSSLSSNPATSEEVSQ